MIKQAIRIGGSLLLAVVLSSALQAQQVEINGLEQMSAAGDEQPARQQLNRFAKGMDSLQASFQQRIIRSDGYVEDQSEGQVWLLKPQRFRWEYGGDFPEIVIADGENIWIYDEVLEQVTIKPQSEFATDSPLSLLTDMDHLDEQFEVREAGDIDQMFLLELRSRNAESEFERVLLGLQNNELMLMALEDAFGIRTEIRFSDLLRNQVLDEGLFQFEPPEGVDIIGSPNLGVLLP